MVRAGRVACIGVLASLAAWRAGAAEVYTYSVHHPFYGVIGTYVDTVERGAGAWRTISRAIGTPMESPASAKRAGAAARMSRAIPARESLFV